MNKPLQAGLFDAEPDVLSPPNTPVEPLPSHSATQNTIEPPSLPPEPPDALTPADRQSYDRLVDYIGGWK